MAVPPFKPSPIPLFEEKSQWQIDYENAIKELDELYPEVEVDPRNIKEEIQMIVKNSKKVVE